MSAWWLLIAMPFAYTAGFVTMCAFASRAYDKGYADGHRAGWEGAATAVAAGVDLHGTMAHKPEVPS